MMDGLRRFFTGASCQNDGRSTGNRIATGVYPFATGLTAVLTHDQPAPGSGLESRGGLNQQGVGLVADGQHYIVYRNGEFGSSPRRNNSWYISTRPDNLAAPFWNRLCT